MITDLKKSDNWINKDPMVLEFISIAKQYYGGVVKFSKNGRKFYSAKLDPSKIKYEDAKKNCKEAYFDINKAKCKNNIMSRDSFFLRMIDENLDVNIFKIF